MSFTEDRFSMSAEKYVGKHYVLVYLEDAIAQLLTHREENPKVESLKFLSQYFSSVRDGNHTLFRQYAFIRSTPHNRASFVWLFWKCFRHIGKKGDLLSIQEYHSLLGLLSTDFPFKLVQKTARIVLIDDALDCLISFSDFIYALQVQFYYEEFLDKCGELYQSVLQSAHISYDPVIVPTSNVQDTGMVHQASHLPADGVDSMQFFRSIFPICDRVSYSTPPVSALKEILFATPRISFYGFLMAIAKSESINEHIGRLPPKAELLEGADVELTTRPFKMSSGGKQPPSGSTTQCSIPGSGSQISNPSQSNSLSSVMRKKVSERIERIRARKQSAPDTSSDSENSSSDSSDSN